MNMLIDTFWERVDHSGPGKLGKVIKGDYVKKSTTDMGPTSLTLETFRRAKKKSRDFLGEPELGKFKFDLNTYYGIHSYQIVHFTN